MLAWINVLAFISVSVYLGGDALNGYVRGGEYFLCAHGRCVEVTKAVWTYSYWHAIGSFGLMVLALGLAAIFVNTGDISYDKYL
jgi:hypothetical protein